MDKQHWKVEKQPAWLVAAIRKAISALPGGYVEAGEWLDVTEDALFNRLRAGGDQMFPMGWAMVMQKAGNTHHVAHAVARASGGVFVPLTDVEDVDNGDINQRLLEAIEQITKYSQQIRVAIEDGVIEPHEREAINTELYKSIVKLQEHTSLVYRVFCEPEKGDARECAAPGAVASIFRGETNA
ncbi:YmfL family putative regulatory protein [Mangrovibacter phragmitis]|uniref:YmfL family putative regulatory protein n=1 Tax=Mangrovibacter phragmitis TaxID=1691903 RepID=UPI003369F8B2